MEHVYKCIYIIYIYLYIHIYIYIQIVVPSRDDTTFAIWFWNISFSQKERIYISTGPQRWHTVVVLQDIEEPIMDIDDLEEKRALGEIPLEGEDLESAVCDLWLERPQQDPATVVKPTGQCALPAGSWSTPQVVKDDLAPGCRIQRRTPMRNFQVHVLCGGTRYSRVFSWSAHGSPSEAEMFQAAIAWSWEEFAKHVA